MQTVRQDQIICEAGSTCHSFYIIAEGSVSAQFGNHYISLGKGDVAGIFDVTCGTHICTYQAQSDAVLIPYKYYDPNGLLSFIKEKEDMRRLLLNSMNAHICKFFDAYSKDLEELKKLHNYVIATKTNYSSIAQEMHFNPKALPFGEELDQISSDDRLSFWLSGYYSDMKKVMNSLNTSVSDTFTFGYIDRCCNDLLEVVSIINDMVDIKEKLAKYLINEDYVDFYDLYSDLFLRAQANGDDTAKLSAILKGIADTSRNLGFINGRFIDSREIKLKSSSVVTDYSSQNNISSVVAKAKLSNSLGEILDFSDTIPTTAAEFKRCLDTFKALPDKEANTPEVNEIRKKLTHLFNIIYSDTVQVAVTKDDVPTIIKMFINFGFVDIESCGNDNALKLFDLAESFHGHKEKGVYTMLEWFKAIYEGQKAPSRNEFEVDYTQYVHSLVKEGKITKLAEAEMLANKHERLLFELNNVFTSVNKITSGRVFTFTPVLLDANLIRSVEELCLTPKRILDALNEITDIDYSAFYHEYIYEDLQVGIKEIVKTEIRPDFILMPNVGTRGVMWQEIEGLNRRSPSRMFLPVLFAENLPKSLMRMTAEYRWEMCKREMGARWNDVTAHSLTGDYCDYIQFFNKNRDLSADAKEKIKNSLRRCKNSFKEMFVADYILFLSYEATGSCRLNKLARSILFKSCPLSLPYREKVANNTIFEECLNRHRISVAQLLHRMDIIEKRYQTNGKVTPDALLKHKELISR